MENEFLKWDSEREGWVCSNCGAFYERPKTWEPPCYFCMKCKCDWGYLDYGNENEKEN